MSVLPASTADAATRGASITRLALEAQTALLPYALVAFGISLPIYVWAGAQVERSAWMTGSYATFGAAWAALYAAVNWLKTPAAADIARRGRIHIICGLIWAAAIAQIAAFADGAGAAREPLLMTALAAAVVCIFFTASWLPSLLIVGPAAALAPLVMLFAEPASRPAATIGWAAIALTLALALMLNRMLRRQFALAAEREALIADRAGAVDAAQRLARSKSDLVATLSHEIRNGLSGVTHVLAAAAGRNGRAAPSREQLAAALDAANDLIAVLDTTLDSETAEAGRLSVGIGPFDPVALLRDLVVLNRPHASAKGLELTLHVDADVAHATSGAAIADAMRARQILSNLIGNALKFTVRGRVEVRVERVGGARLAIEVADTGPGLSDDELIRAFEPFHRIERTSVGTSGAGLGLSLSHQLAQLMGGELKAHSAPGVGTCMRLELPYDPLAEREPAEGPDETQAPSLNEGRHLRILIAEDDALNAAMLRAILEQLGHQVVHAVDGKRAVDLARICEFDLLMIDGRMPVLDGPQATAAIRALPEGSGQAPIIAVIGGDAEEALECTAAGADAVLRKPVSVGAVARAVADATAVEHRDLALHVA